MYKQRRIFYTLNLVITLGFMFFARNSYAEFPLKSLKNTIDKVIATVSDPQNKGAENMKKRRDLIRGILDESFNYEEMGKRSLGRRWRKLKTEERKEFLGVFSLLLKTSYVKKIEGYKNENIDYVSEEKDGEYAVCKTIIHTDTNDIPINYKMMIRNDKTWAAYDVIIEGVSLVSNYRRQFKKLIRRDGYKKMIKSMIKKTEEIKKEEKAH